MLDTRHIQRGTVKACECCLPRAINNSGTPLPAIEPGLRVGMLTVFSPTKRVKNNRRFWLCRCDCGSEVEFDARSLRLGTVRDCGCVTKARMRSRDLTGQRFGRLIALEPTEKREKGRIVWRCICDCGNEAFAPVSQLVNGYKKSCGCLSRPPLKDFIGRRFGRLLVDGYAGKRGMHRWHCRCDCGRETVVGQTLLQSGKTRSCGCLSVDRLMENRGLCEGTSVRALEYYKINLSPSNTSGYNGVYQNKRTGRWVAQITFKGKTRYLGSFAKKDEAIRARRRAEEEIDNFLEDYYEQNPEWQQPDQQRKKPSA